MNKQANVTMSAKVTKSATVTKPAIKRKLRSGPKLGLGRKRRLRLGKTAAVRQPIIGAYAAGKLARAKILNLSQAELNVELQHSWSIWFLGKKLKRFYWKSYLQAANSFKLGFFNGLQQVDTLKLPHLLLLPTHKKVAVILSVLNEEKTIFRVLSQLARLSQAEIIIVVNGSKDNSFTIAHDHPAQPIILYYDSPLGFDVGRAIGAKAADADILLFLDGDMIISSEQLLPFIYAVERGADLALNDLSSYLHAFSRRDPVTLMKEFMNKSLGRGDLQANSLTAVPHAISQKAIRVVGCSHLAVPPVAQAIAIQSGLKVVAPHTVDVIRNNKKKSLNVGTGNPVEQMIVGDYLEALYEVMRQQGGRLRMPDKLRKRQMIGGHKLAAN